MIGDRRVTMYVGGHTRRICVAHATDGSTGHNTTVRLLETVTPTTNEVLKPGALDGEEELRELELEDVE